MTRTRRGRWVLLWWLLVVGAGACGGDDGEPGDPSGPGGVSDTATAEMCGTLDVVGASEPAPEQECALGPTAAPGVTTPQWATLHGTLCNIAGIPDAGLDGSECTDPQQMEVDVTEDGLQSFSASFVVGDFADPGNPNPFAFCAPSSIGTLTVSPMQTEFSGKGGATFTINQATAEFVVGTNAHFPPMCAVAISDSHGQQILVNVGTQISVQCAQSSCTGGSSAIASAIASAERRRRRP